MPDQFWRLTYQEFYLLILRFHKELEEKNQQTKDTIWLHGDLKQHIANFSMVHRKDKQPWTFEDFTRMPGTEDKQRERLTLKQAKERLGSKFELHDN